MHLFPCIFRVFFENCVYAWWAKIWNTQGILGPQVVKRLQKPKSMHSRSKKGQEWPAGSDKDRFCPRDKPVVNRLSNAGFVFSSVNTEIRLFVRLEGRLGDVFSVVWRVRRKKCFLGAQFYWRTVLPDPTLPTSCVPRRDAPVVRPGFALDKLIARKRDCTITWEIRCFSGHILLEKV